MSNNSVGVIGVEDVQRVLREIAPNHARNLARATVHGIAGEVTKLAKQNVPVNTGRLKSAIKTKRLKSPPDKPQSAVYIATGKGAKADGFYWRFVEFGTNPSEKRSFSTREHPFLRPARDKVFAQLTEIFIDQFGKKLEKLLAREAKRKAKR